MVRDDQEVLCKGLLTPSPALITRLILRFAFPMRAFLLSGLGLPGACGLVLLPQHHTVHVIDIQMGLKFASKGSQHKATLRFFGASSPFPNKFPESHATAAMQES
eukprot:CAMPEP_0119114542 /NCGR_PEP_ID=MMETSP1180-20130426/47822_1 /TAXON_ID=3052 ORGANISM="Chlamydomonas cf sp, Strain CCMP681" /NCGR_SAMPLE_ID=MMETSP1180 /ASSEMBLY_ACC=CAM_ASM_000741 /LENGTH=104 /DNA_ID=CAMNT_0007103131 /DNA_START=185 /DNA_END=497 /DNA_ORIENTATION=-